MSSWVRIACLSFLLLFGKVWAQPQYAFRISFTDKKGSPSISNPLAFLSQRAIDRRTNQGLSVDSTDRPVSPLYIDTVLSVTSGKMHLTSRWLNHCVILLNDSSKILLLQGKPYIKAIKYIAYYPTGLHNKPGDNSKSNTEKELSLLSHAKTTGLQSYYNGSYTQTHLVNGDYLHDHGYKGKGMLIAVLDEGFSWVDTNPAFDSMRLNGRLVDQFNFVLRNTDVYNFSSHGTSALSTCAAYIPDTFVGAAPEASYAIYVTEYASQEQEIELDNALAATERADSIGADILSISLGYNLFTNPFYYPFVYSDIDGHSSVAAKGANMATAKGMIYVASAGNEGGGAWNYILTPGDADSALTIGSVNEFKSPAANSGFGPNASGRVKPDVCMQGNPAAVLSSGTGTQFINGTSFATPQLAGWAACLWQSAHSNNSYKIRRAIVESAHIYPASDNQLGYGVPDFMKAQELLGIKEVDVPLSAERWVAVWPNPFTETATVKVLKDRPGTLDIYVVAADGRKVIFEQKKLHQGIYSFTLDTSGLPAGNYYLKIIAADKQSITPLVRK